MPSFQDSAVIFFLALLLFGPKKLPELARQLGKLMGEFRRASNEFRTQMEDELRTSEQLEKQKQIAAIEAAAPAPPSMQAVTTNAIASPPAGEDAQTIADSINDPLDTHPHMAPPDRHIATSDISSAAPSAPLPIATSGDLSLMPPATGLPIARSTTFHETPSSVRLTPSREISPAPTESASTLTPMLDSIPQAPDHTLPPRSVRRDHTSTLSDEAVTHG